MSLGCGARSRSVPASRWRPRARLGRRLHDEAAVHAHVSHPPRGPLERRRADHGAGLRLHARGDPGEALGGGPRRSQVSSRPKRAGRSNAKTVRVVLRSRSAAGGGSSRVVLPRHALRGEDFANIWTDRIDNPRTGRPIGSGPFLVAARERGRAASRFVRNPRYWGPHRAYLDRIVVRFCQSRTAPTPWSSRSRFCAKESSISSRSSGRRRAGAGVPAGSRDRGRSPTTRPAWEHLDIRMRRGGHPALEEKEARAAGDRIRHRSCRHRAASTAGEGSRPSESAVFCLAATALPAELGGYRHRPAEARRLLEQAGCRRGWRRHLHVRRRAAVAALRDDRRRRRAARADARADPGAAAAGRHRGRCRSTRSIGARPADPSERRLRSRPVRLDSGAGPSVDRRSLRLRWSPELHGLLPATRDAGPRPGQTHPRRGRARARC